MLINFLTSPSSIFDTGMPVHFRNDGGNILLVDFFLQHAGCPVLPSI